MRSSTRAGTDWATLFSTIAAMAASSGPAAAGSVASISSMRSRNAMISALVASATFVSGLNAPSAHAPPKAMMPPRRPAAKAPSVPPFLLSDLSLDLPPVEDERSFRDAAAFALGGGEPAGAGVALELPSPGRAAALRSVPASLRPVAVLLADPVFAPSDAADAVLTDEAEPIFGPDGDVADGSVLGLFVSGLTVGSGFAGSASASLDGGTTLARGASLLDELAEGFDGLAFVASPFVALPDVEPADELEPVKEAVPWVLASLAPPDADADDPPPDDALWLEEVLPLVVVVVLRVVFAPASVGLLAALPPGAV